MMPAVYVLDVPEFRPLIDCARGIEGCRVEGPRLGYFRVSRPGRLEFVRKQLGFKPAVWHGALTGGLDGRVVQFDNDRLAIEEADAP
jgi:hypothetical protein